MKLDYSLSDSIEALRVKRTELLNAARNLTTTSEEEKRSLNNNEEQEFEGLKQAVEAINLELKEREMNGTTEPIRAGRRSIPGGFNSEREIEDSGNVTVLKPNQRLSDLIPKNQQSPAPNLSIGKYIKGIVTGDWTNAKQEMKAMVEGTQSAGGYLVPTPLATEVIDKARNQARVFQAGALTVPMTSQTLSLAKVTGDPTASWKAENAAIAASDMTFGQVKLDAKVLVALIKMSVELFEDAQNINQVVEQALTQALALELDRAALRGSGTAPEPRGIKNTSGIQTIDLGNNGGQISNYSKFSNAVQKIQEANGADQGLATIYAPRTAGTIDDLTDTTGQPLRPPTSFENLLKLSTNQVPTNLTKGTATNASEAYVGDFSQLLMGIRTNLVIEASRQAADDSGSAFGNLQVWIRAYLRADVQLARPEHFVLIDGIIPTP